MSDNNNMNLVGNDNNGTQQGRKHIEVSKEDVSIAECDCGGQVFQQAHQLAKLSKVHPKNPTGQTQLVPLPVHICLGCGAAKQDQDFYE